MNIVYQIILFVCCPCIHAQFYGVEWENTIHGNMSDNLLTISQTSDGGYIIGGYSNSDNSIGDKTEDTNGGNDIWIVKLNSEGTIEWQNTIGGSEIEMIGAIIETSDDHYIIGGSSTSGISGDKTEAQIGGFDYWVIKLDEFGEILWQKVIGGNESDGIHDILETIDNGFILAGTSSSSISGNKTEDSKGGIDMWIVKVDIDGNVEWDKTIGGGLDDYLEGIVLTSDGGYVVGGPSLSGVSGDKSEPLSGDSDYWVVKIDGVGDIVWENTIGGIGSDHLEDLIINEDDECFLLGSSNSDVSIDKSEDSKGSFDYWIVKIDGDGEILWDKTIGGSNLENLFTGCITGDEGIILAGKSGSGISEDKSEPSKGGTDYWIVKINAFGEINWDKTIGGNEGESLQSIEETGDNGFILGGSSESQISGDKSEPTFERCYWVVKLVTCESINNTIILDGVTITAQEEGMEYQWINCTEGGVIIDGANEQNFTPVENGAYAVIINNGDCQVISDCVTINSLRIYENVIFDLKVYPNPGIDLVNFDMKGFQICEVVIFDTSGNLMFQGQLNGSSIDVSFLPSGLYLIKLYCEGLNYQGALVKT